MVNGFRQGIVEPVSQVETALSASISKIDHHEVRFKNNVRAFLVVRLERLQAGLRRSVVLQSPTGIPPKVRAKFPLRVSHKFRELPFRRVRGSTTSLLATRFVPSRPLAMMFASEALALAASHVDFAALHVAFDDLPPPGNRSRGLVGGPHAVVQRCPSPNVWNTRRCLPARPSSTPHHSLPSRTLGLPRCPSPRHRLWPSLPSPQRPRIHRRRDRPRHSTPRPSPPPVVPSS